MKLYCARHGEALAADIDDARVLSEKGRAEVQKIANHLQQCGVEINHVIYSPKLRAQQTAEIFANTLNILDRHESAALVDADADPDSYIETIQSWTEDTLIVGHLPFLHRLVSQLVTHDSMQYPIINYPPGAVVCLDYFDIHRWVIKWHIVPSIMI